ncbi:MAG: NUDIX hydrolase, partial [Haloechinothrix sp.]
MTPVPVTPALLHDLVAGSHAEGITALAVACTVTHDDHILLLAEPGRDFIDTTWQPPVGPVLPGEALIDALPKTLTLAGLTIDEVIGYMGHHDHHDDGETTRVFCFAVTVTDPDSICRLAHIGHRWVDLGDLPDLPPPAGQHRMALASWVPASHHESPQRLAQALRAWAHGLYAAEAGTELLIRHAAWLHRSDFRDRFVDWDI